MNFKINTSTNSSPYLTFSDRKGGLISSKVLSDIRSVIVEMKQRKSDYLYVANDIDDVLNPLDEESFRLFERILRTEPSYLRFDHDVENPDTKEHPMNHIDINFSHDFTFKLGLDRRIDLEELIKILNAESYCRKINLHELVQL